MLSYTYLIWRGFLFPFFLQLSFVLDPLPNGFGFALFTVEVGRGYENVLHDYNHSQFNFVRGWCELESEDAADVTMCLRACAWLTALSPALPVYLRLSGCGCSRAPPHTT